MTRARTDRVWSDELALPVTALAVLACIVVVVEAAAMVTGLLTGAGTTLLSFADVVALVRAGLGVPLPPDSAVAHLAAHATLFVGCVVATTAILVTLGLLLGRRVWRRWAPAPPGHASRAEVVEQLSLQAARASAERTRRSMRVAERRAAPGGEVGVPLHRFGSRELWASFAGLTGTLAPTQSGKSRMDLVHKVIEAPGAVLCSTTKLDLVEFAALARARRRLAGPVVVYDSTGRLLWPAPLQSSPVAGCHDQQEAARRAFILVEAAAVQVEAGGPGSAGNDSVFRERARVVLTAYLMAAAVSGQGTDAILGWATQPPPERDESPARRGPRFAVDEAPATILEDAGRDEVAANLRAEMGMDPRTASSVWMSVRRVVGAWTNPRVQQLCNPHGGDGLDVRAFIAAGGSLFLIADEEQAADEVPVLTALVHRWLRVAQNMALDYPARRVEPPVTVVLDELANATPVPGLAKTMSDAAGRGAVIHWAAQSLAQLERVFGTVGWREVIDNTRSLTVWGGIKDERTLALISELCGTHERTRHQHQSDGLLSGGRRSTSTETAPVMRPGDIRKLRPGHVLVIHGGLPCFIARAVDVTRRRDAAELARDTTTLRDHTAIPITARGYHTSSTAD